MSDETQLPGRRTVLRTLAATSAVAGSPIAAATDGRQGGSPPKRNALAELAVEAAFHPKRSAAAITTLGLGDGYQLYWVRDVDSVDEVVHAERDLVQLSDAEAGVHGVHWPIADPTVLAGRCDPRTRLRLRRLQQTHHGRAAVGPRRRRRPDAGAGDGPRNHSGGRLVPDRLQEWWERLLY